MQIFSQITSSLKKVVIFLARTDIFFYTLFWLMFLVVVGTLDQRNIGLYQAQLKYFSSLYFWIGPIPLPGAYITMAVVFFGLICRMIAYPNWSRKNLGVNITHIGSLLLLLGGFLTAEFSKEGSMALREGTASDFFIDSHDVELSVVDTSPAGHNQVTAFPKEWLTAGTIISHSTLPFKIEVIAFYPNAEPARRPTPAGDDYHGFAKMFSLNSLPFDKEEYKNQSGLVFKVTGASSGQDGHYAIFEGMTVAQELKTDHGTFTLELRKAQTKLPFAIKLLEFNKLNYPSTDMAKGYRSFVELTDGGITQKYLIQMNEPLRYKSYILFQSSFSESADGKVSVFSVVKNMGAMFPYISSIIMCFGLLIHLISKVPAMISRKGVAK